MKRRARLQRHTPLRDGSPLGVRGTARAPKGTTRSTGPSRSTVAACLVRAGWACEICCQRLDTALAPARSIHHRIPRGMGGSAVPEINSPSNLLVLCGTGTTGCHGYVESHRSESYRMGWLVHRGANPAEVPVWQPYRARWVLLAADGTCIGAAS